MPQIGFLNPATAEDQISHLVAAFRSIGQAPGIQLNFKKYSSKFQKA
jgi:hypothetical protein